MSSKVKKQIVSNSLSSSKHFSSSILTVYSDSVINQVLTNKVFMTECIKLSQVFPITALHPVGFPPLFSNENAAVPAVVSFLFWPVEQQLHNSTPDLQVESQVSQHVSTLTPGTFSTWLTHLSRSFSLRSRVGNRNWRSPTGSHKFLRSDTGWCCRNVFWRSILGRREN